MTEKQIGRMWDLLAEWRSGCMPDTNTAEVLEMLSEAMDDRVVGAAGRVALAAEMARGMALDEIVRRMLEEPYSSLAPEDLEIVTVTEGSTIRSSVRVKDRPAYVCGFCNARSPESEEAALAHAATCPKHPAVQRAERLEANNATLRKRIRALEAMPTFPAPQPTVSEATIRCVRCQCITAAGVACACPRIEELEIVLKSYACSGEHDGGRCYGCRAAMALRSVREEGGR